MTAFQAAMGTRAAPDLTRVALQQAQRSAEALFETKSVADIKKVLYSRPAHRAPCVASFDLLRSPLNAFGLTAFCQHQATCLM